MNDEITIFLCGDVMTGRGIDQILPRPSDPELHEPRVRDAREYVHLAEAAHGPVPRPVNDDYVWGDAIQEWNQIRPEVKIVNLETAITSSDDFWKGKDIHYRMSPNNIGCLGTAKIDCCTLANNHVLDWGYQGLEETLKSLDLARIRTAGAGRNLVAAEAPAFLDVGTKGQVLVLSLGFESSGIPREWRAGPSRAGVNLLPNLSDATVQLVKKMLTPHCRAQDVVVASIHWGPNWGYSIPVEQRRFAHRLIDLAGVDIVHGHSSHHVKGIEVYRSRLILYGCGDFLTDYEGISGYEVFRGDMALMYFATVEMYSGRLIRLRMSPLHLDRMQLRRPGSADIVRLQKTLNRECDKLGTRVEHSEHGMLALCWDCNREQKEVDYSSNTNAPGASQRGG
ncbi:MAG TPA: CapA family protein [Lacipirellulaceae bacterium]|nr:CapA family protein [Lacipirellulaceae bacterium]